MSTKALVIVMNGDITSFIVRPHDGYCAVTGAEIAEILFRLGPAANAASVTTALLNSKFAANAAGALPAPVYHLVDSMPDDIAHAYCIDYSDGAFRLAWSYKPPNIGEVEPSVWIERTQRDFDSLKAFTDAVNMEVNALNNALHQKGIKQGAVAPLPYFLPGYPARVKTAPAPTAETPNTAVEQAALELIKAKLLAVKGNSKVAPAVAGRGTGAVKEAIGKSVAGRADVRKPAVTKAALAAVAAKGKAKGKGGK